MARVSRIRIETDDPSITPRELQFIAALAQLRIDLSRIILVSTRGTLVETPADARDLALDASDFISKSFPDLKIRVLDGLA